MSDPITVDRARAAIKEYYGKDEPEQREKKKTKVKKAKKIQHRKEGDWMNKEGTDEPARVHGLY